MTREEFLKEHEGIEFDFFSGNSNEIHEIYERHLDNDRFYPDENDFQGMGAQLTELINAYLDKRGIEKTDIAVQTLLLEGMNSDVYSPEFRDADGNLLGHVFCIHHMDKEAFDDFVQKFFDGTRICLETLAEGLHECPNDGDEQTAVSPDNAIPKTEIVAKVRHVDLKVAYQDYLEREADDTRPSL